MLNMAITVGCLLLSGLVLTLGLNYVNTDHFVVIGAQQVASSGRFAIRQGVDAYRVANRGALPTADAGSGFPSADLDPYMLPPVAGYGMTWTYFGDGSGGYYACLTGASVAKAAFDGLVAAETLDDETIVAPSCSATQSDHAYGGGASFKFRVN